jgi:hypothetical protein
VSTLTSVLQVIFHDEARDTPILTPQASQRPFLIAAHVRTHQTSGPMGNVLWTAGARALNLYSVVFKVFVTLQVLAFLRIFLENSLLEVTQKVQNIWK